MRQAFNDVLAFERAAERTIPDGKPGAVSDADLGLAMDLLKEEYEETYEAMECACINLAKVGTIHPLALAEIADGLADLAWVTLAAAVRLGIDLPACWEAVREANMAKFGPGSWKDENLKVRKPPGWTPPDIAGVLASQKPLNETYPANGGES